MKKLNIITKTNLHDDYFDEYPNFMCITLTSEFVKRVNGYRKAMETMKAEGLSPYAIKEFDDCMFADPVEWEVGLSKEDNIAFLSDDVKEEWNSNFDKDEDEEFVTLAELDRDCDFRVDVMTLNVSTSGLNYRGIVKHCNINFESDVIGWGDFDKLSKLITVSCDHTTINRMVIPSISRAVNDIQG